MIPPEDFESLAERFLWGEVSPEERAGLNESIVSDPRLALAFIEVATSDAMLREILREPAAAGAGKVSRTARRGRRTARVRWGSWISIAACLTIIAGTLVYNHWRSTQFAEVLVAHIRATVPGVRIVRNGQTIIATIDGSIFSGDRIETGEDETATFVYDGENTEIEVKEHTSLEIRSVNEGKRLRLEEGIIDATVDPQPADRPMIVTTPQARVEVKGTRLSLGVKDDATRLEVFEGLVRLTRLSDGEFADVAGGQYAVAAEGVELAARSILGPVVPEQKTDQPAKAPPAGSFAVLSEAEYPKPRTHLDGKLLFEDDFDGPSDNWEVVIGSQRTGFDAVTTNPERYLKLLEAKADIFGEGRAFRMGRPPTQMAEDVSLAVVNPYPGGIVGPKRPKGYRRYVGIRSRRPVGAERFVVEARFALQKHGRCWIPAIEMLQGQGQLLARMKRVTALSLYNFDLYRWEFEPAKDAPGGNVLICCHFIKASKGGTPMQFRESTRVTPVSRRLLFTLSSTDMCMDRVTVREFKEEPAGAGTR